MRVLGRPHRLLLPYRATLALGVALLLIRAAVELAPVLHRIREVSGHQELVGQGGSYGRHYWHPLAATADD